MYMVLVEVFGVRGWGGLELGRSLNPVTLVIAPI